MDNDFKYFAPTIGVVVSTDDPAQAGRLRVYCPHWDTQTDMPVTESEIAQIKWAEYAGPFLGSTKNIATGPEETTSFGQTGFGLWMIPKYGSRVLVQCINGDPNRRFWTHCVFPSVQSNRSLPSARGYKDGVEGPFTDSYEEMQPYYDNIREAGLDKGDHYHTRAYERSVAQPKTDKDGTEGYATNPSTKKGYDPQTYCLTTPGHHFISLQDSPEFCRVRVKTNNGHQIIFDDTNERIYVSTAKGRTYFEMDQDGHIHVYAKESISFRTESDFNIEADKNINIHSGKSINIKADVNVNVAGIDINTTAYGSLFDSVANDINIGAGGLIIEKGDKIHLNGPPAAPAAKPILPPIKPKHEPWDRPASKIKRGDKWRK